MGGLQLDDQMLKKLVASDYAEHMQAVACCQTLEAPQVDQIGQEITAINKRQLALTFVLVASVAAAGIVGLRFEKSMHVTKDVFGSILLLIAILVGFSVVDTKKLRVLKVALLNTRATNSLTWLLRLLAADQRQFDRSPGEFYTHMVVLIQLEPERLNMITTKERAALCYLSRRIELRGGSAEELAFAEAIRGVCDHGGP